MLNKEEKMKTVIGTYIYKTMAGGEIIIILHPCKILAETELSYKIDLSAIKPWYEDDKPIKWVRKRKVRINKEDIK